MLNKQHLSALVVLTGIILMAGAGDDANIQSEAEGFVGVPAYRSWTVEPDKHDQASESRTDRKSAPEKKRQRWKKSPKNEKGSQR